MTLTLYCDLTNVCQSPFNDDNARKHFETRSEEKNAKKKRALAL
jgi:hypothetical protein